MTKADDIQDRLIQFADMIITSSDTLSRTTAAEHIASQLLRSAITPAIKFIEARLAETTAERISNLRIAVVALTESEIWLRSIIAGDMLSPDTLVPLITDCQQLQRALIAGIKYKSKPQTIDHQLTNYPNTQLPN